MIKKQVFTLVVSPSAAINFFPSFVQGAGVLKTIVTNQYIYATLKHSDEHEPVSPSHVLLDSLARIQVYAIWNRV